MIETLLQKHDIDPWIAQDVIIPVGGIELVAHGGTNHVEWWVSSKTWAAIHGNAKQPTVTYTDEHALGVDFVMIQLSL